MDSSAILRLSKLLVVAMLCASCGGEQPSTEKADMNEEELDLATQDMSASTDSEMSQADLGGEDLTSRCPEGTALLINTGRCEPITCLPDEYVHDHQCRPCEPGTYSLGGDEVRGEDTNCTPIICTQNMHVVDHGCTLCAAGTTREAGDDARGEDTACSPVLCASDQRVENNRCVDCFGSTPNEAGDDARGEDTYCDDQCSAIFGITCDFFSRFNYLKADQPAQSEYFGHAVALDGDRLVVGAPGEASSQGDSRAGAVYVFEFDNFTMRFERVARLVASNAQEDDFFGRQVAIKGDVIVVGAPDEDSATGSMQGDNSAGESGAVYVFERTNAGQWAQQAYLKASNAGESDRFGKTLAFDGQTLVVAAPEERSRDQSLPDNDELLYSGAIYVFAKDNAGQWAQQSYLKAPTPQQDAEFGRTLALEDDRIVVSSLVPQAAAQVHIFARDASGWSHRSTLQASNGERNDDFGTAIALQAPWLAVGARGEGSNSTQIDMGQSNNDANSAGAVYIYKLDGEQWTQQAYIKAPNAEDGDNFGLAVALLDSWLIVGAPYEDSDAKKLQGDMSNNDRRNSGAVYAFERTSMGWQHRAYLKMPIPTAGDEFGTHLAAHGKRFVVGVLAEGSASPTGDQSDDTAPDSGAAFIYRILP